MRPMIEQVRTKLSIAFGSAKYLTTGNVAHNKAAIETNVEAALRDLDKIKSEQREIDIRRAVEIYERELKQLVAILNRFSKDKIGDIISIEGSVKDFENAMKGE